MSCSLLTVFARLIAPVLVMGPLNDKCEDAFPISGDGEFAYSNVDATVNDVTGLCSGFGVNDPSFQADVWYCWTADCTGPVTIDTCGSTVATTKIAVYDGCKCPADGFLTCATLECASQSMAQFYAHAGESYLIRIGSYPTFSADGDSFRIACRSYRFDYETLCNSDVNPVVFSSICESRSRWDALNSTRGQYRIVEDFVAEESGSINTICWAGTYLDNEDGKECIRYSDDDFEVTYFADDCGAPGAVMAHHPFSQEAGTLDVIGPAMTHVEFPNGGQEFEFSGEHASFEVTAGQTYWVRITNSAAGECGWYWETTPRAGYAIQIDESNQSSQPVHNDLAFCFDVRRIPADGCDVPVLPNDDCPSALPLVLGATEFNTATAITDGPEQYYGDSCYLPLGDRQIHKDIWFGLENPCSGKLELSLCQSDFDTKLAVYEDLDMDCNVLWFTSMKACSDDDCEPPSTLQSVISFDVSATVNYKIRIGGYENAWGQGRLVARYVPPVVASLRDFAAMSQCFTGSCTAPCIPLSLPACCFVQDIDADGDVDLDDAANLISVFTNPQP